ncbi:sensor histidine kinase [Amycolatopsis alkalitolerans]|uniref:histidine kinase n=1 Tax=Amycolatopsis alkalitolerans TaxID=2547244 RepID=A0A5C4M0C2_9PSEU|nr:HAMP domain-containing sensor histidine kinase [Amycolatopsis alkalitolerans]TNC25850.1 HAMP domain-containing histidine kinase [Amycolatopsis alkalitolerans]
MNRRWPAVGLRARLLLAFALLTVVTAVAVAGGSYVLARNLILQQAQDAAVQAMTTRLQALFPLRDPAPDPTALGEIAGAVTDRDATAVAIYHNMRSAAGLDPGVIPAELRAVVGDGKIAWQRVRWGAAPVLIIGTPLLITGPDGTTPSGIEVYTARSLLAEQASIAQLATRASLAGGVALLFSVVLALLAARGVLRPVRELGRAARRLGEGELWTRIAVHGTDELADVARTFNTTAGELERHVERLRAMEADARRFVADVSHELRTPLAAVAAVAGVLEEEAGRLPEDAGKAARLVSEETHNLTRLVNDLMEISRFDSGTAALALDEVEVAAVIQASLRARGWTDLVRTDLAPAVTARLDARRVDVMVANLVGNALRHGEPEVSVTLAADPEWLTVELRDHGPGLDPAILPRVFDRFWKADAARARSAGSGLGLAIARENANLHGGSIAAGNSPGGGAVFTLRLPRWAGRERG